MTNKFYNKAYFCPKCKETELRVEQIGNDETGWEPTGTMVCDSCGFEMPLGCFHCKGKGKYYVPNGEDDVDIEPCDCEAGDLLLAGYNLPNTYEQNTTPNRERKN